LASDASSVGLEQAEARIIKLAARIALMNASSSVPEEIAA
jgi:hypothetical protein